MQGELNQVPMDHEFDGIQEYDNPMPGWWVGIFILTVIFAFLYGFYYSVPMPERSVFDTYNASVAEDLKVQFEHIGTLKNDTESLAGYLQREDLLAMGKADFQANCISCHGSEGQGLLGPNMTDNFYKNIKVLGDIPQVVEKGALGGAMPAWNNRLHPNDIILVSVYVASLRGKNLKGPRPAEGVEIAPWPVAAAANGAGKP